MLSEPLLVPGARKIAVLRANALGDFIAVLPALDAVRAAYPDAEITFLGKQWHVDFLRDRPCPVDRVIAVPPSRGVSAPPDIIEDPTQLERFFEAMVRERFDLAVQVHGGGDYSNPFVRRLGARMTVGLRGLNAPPLDRYVPYVFFQHEVLRYLEVMGLLGAKPVTLEPHVAVTAADVAESEREVPDDPAPLVAVHPAANDPRRRWPPERFAAVADSLAAAGARIVVLGTERELVDAVIGQMHWSALALYDRLSVSGLAGLLSRCALLLANDSGPAHLAEAVGARTLTIYWCGNVVNWGPVTRARHRQAISWQVTCPECGVDGVAYRCNHRASYVMPVRTETVMGTALELLGDAVADAGGSGATEGSMRRDGAA